MLPGIDLHAALDTHTYGSMWVRSAMTGASGSEDCWVLAGDLVYKFENLGDSGAGGDADRMYIPIGLAVGSQTNLLLTTEEMVEAGRQ